MTDRYGREDYDINFEYGEGTSVYLTCMLFYNNEPWFFGGEGDNVRQISKINGCRLENVGDLAFPFYDGACTMFRQKLFLCFDRIDGGNEMKLCRTADSPFGEFTAATYSHYNHDYHNDLTASNG